MKDELYRQRKKEIEKFRFTSQVSEVFDDMIRRSVPGYTESLLLGSSLIYEAYQENSLIYDLGCSTGAVALALQAQFHEKPFRYAGVDNSKAMIEKARNSVKPLSGQKITFQEADISSMSFEKAGIVVSSYTLQFIPPGERENTVRRIYSCLEPGGVFLMSEKVLEETNVLSALFQKMHHDWKKSEGYSDLEISQKREAIEDVLIPFSVEKNLEMLKTVGFSTTGLYFKRLNFASFIAIK